MTTAVNTLQDSRLQVARSRFEVVGCRLAGAALEPATWNLQPETWRDPYVRRADCQALEWGVYASGELRYTQALDEALAGADCAVLVTRHREYLDAALLKAAAGMCTRVVVDGRGCLHETSSATAHVTCLGLGRGRPNSGEPPPAETRPAQEAMV